MRPEPVCFDEPLPPPRSRLGELDREGAAESFQSLYELLGEAHQEDLRRQEERMQAEIRSLSQKISGLRRQLADDDRREPPDRQIYALPPSGTFEECGDQPRVPKAVTSPSGRRFQTMPSTSTSPAGAKASRPNPAPLADDIGPATPPSISPATVRLPGEVFSPVRGGSGDDGGACDELEEALREKDDQTSAKRNSGEKLEINLPFADHRPSELGESPPSSWVRFEMLHIYEDHGGGSRANHSQIVSELTGGHYRTPRQITLRQKSSFKLEDLHPSKTLAQWIIGHPRSPMRVAWELVGSVLIGYDMVMVPLAVFCYPDNEVTIAMDWFTLVFWTLNMLNTITVGFEHEQTSTIVMDSKEILKHYLKCWFWMDLVVLLPDWTLSILSFGTRTPGRSACDTQSAEGSSIKLLRSLRLVRLVRLTRMTKLRKLWQKLQQMILSVTVSIAANIMVMVLLLLVISHFFSCAWFYISFNWNGDDRWLTVHQMDDAAWYYQYATAMHWSITQFTPASMQIVPHNMAERVFTICVVVFALVGFSYVVGSITGSLTQLRSLHEEESKQFWDLRRYLKRNFVDLDLSKRIQRYLEHAWQRQAEHQNVNQVKILTLLSEQLHSELLFELSNRHLKVHPLFEELHSVSRVSVFRLASSAIHSRQLAKHDHLFIRGEAPSHMYLVIQGRLEYKKRDSLGKVRQEWVDKGEDWIAEPSMWSSAWFHLGDCQAVLESRLMLVDPMQFAEVVKRNPSAWLLVTNYCRKFLEWLNAESLDDLSDISQGENIEELIQSFMELDAPRSPEGEECLVTEKLEDSFQLPPASETLLAARKA